MEDLRTVSGIVELWLKGRSFKEMLAFFLDNKVLSVEGCPEAGIWPGNMSVNGNEYVFHVVVARELSEDRTWWSSLCDPVAVTFLVPDEELASIRESFKEA